MPNRFFFTFAIVMALLVPLASFQDPSPPKPTSTEPGTPQQTRPGQAEQQQEQQKDDQKSDVISIDTTVVVLNVTVTDATEQYVKGLRAQDFKILEDQVPQKITSFSFNEMPFAAVILLDTSGSMERKMSIARSACARFVDGIRLGDVVSIYGFGGTKVTKLQDFSEVRDVNFSIWDTDAEGMTPLYDGIVTGAEALAGRPERRRVIMLLSDGADTKSKATYENAMKRAVAAEVAVYSVDLSDAALYKTTVRDLGSEVMKSFSQKTGGKFFKTPGGSQLGDAFTQTVDELRNQYTITYETTNDKQDGKWRAVQASVGRPGMIVRTKQGYYAKKVK